LPDAKENPYSHYSGKTKREKYKKSKIFLLCLKEDNKKNPSHMHAVFPHSRKCKRPNLGDIIFVDRKQIIGSNEKHFFITVLRDLRPSIPLDPAAGVSHHQARSV